MAPPRNDILRSKIRQRNKELKHLSPKERCTLLRKEFDLEPWRLQYYLREKNTDRRRKYSERLLKQLSLDEAALQPKARELNVSEDALRAAVLRYVKRAVKPIEPKTLQSQGYFTWTSRKEAGKLGFSPGDVSEARRLLKRRFGLNLGYPNLLVHIESGRFYPCALKEQTRLIVDPVDFVTRYAREIAAGWHHKDEALVEGLRKE